MCFVTILIFAIFSMDAPDLQKSKKTSKFYKTKANTVKAVEKKKEKIRGRPEKRKRLAEKRIDIGSKRRTRKKHDEVLALRNPAISAAQKRYRANRSVTQHAKECEAAKVRKRRYLNKPGSRAKQQQHRRAHYLRQKQQKKSSQTCDDGIEAD